MPALGWRSTWGDEDSVWGVPQVVPGAAQARRVGTRSEAWFRLGPFATRKQPAGAIQWRWSIDPSGMIGSGRFRDRMMGEVRFVADSRAGGAGLSMTRDAWRWRCREW